MLRRCACSVEDRKRTGLPARTPYVHSRSSPAPVSIGIFRPANLETASRGEGVTEAPRQRQQKKRRAGRRARLVRGLSRTGRAAPGRFSHPFGLSLDRKSTRLNSSHVKISYAVFCLKKKT